MIQTKNYILPIFLLFAGGLIGCGSTFTLLNAPEPTTLANRDVTSVVVESVSATDVPSKGIETRPNSEQIAANPEEIAAGLKLYQELYCGTCHTYGAANTAGLFGPTHDGIMTIVEERIQTKQYVGEATTVAEYLRESVTDPGVHITDGYAGSRYAMPPYVHLTEEELDALVAALMYGESDN